MVGGTVPASAASRGWRWLREHALTIDAGQFQWQGRWAPDRSATIDFRGTLETDGGATIYMHGSGRCDMSGGVGEAGVLYGAPIFESLCIVLVQSTSSSAPAASRDLASSASSSPRVPVAAALHRLDLGEVDRPQQAVR